MAAPVVTSSELVDLALLGLLLQDGPTVATSPVAKMLKKALDQAVAEGFVELHSERREDPSKLDARGRPRKFTIKQFTLTDAGRSRLRGLPHPEARAVAEAGLWRQLHQDLTSSVEALRAEVSRHIDDGFVNLVARLPVAEAEEASTQAAQSLRDQLAAAYRQLCHRAEYADGLVDIPRLFRMVSRVVPSLTTEAMKAELTRLWLANDLQLRVVNEVHELAPDQQSFGISHGNALHYYVFWPQERP